MIKLLDFIADANILLQYEEDGRIETIPFSAIKEYWVYATSEDFEGGSAYVNGPYIVGFITVSNGQGGIVFVWNSTNHKIVHISEGAYTISVLLYGDTVYNLCYVMNYTTPACFKLCKSRLGTKDVSTDADVVEFDCACLISEYNGDFCSVKLMADKDRLYMYAGGKKYPIRIDYTHWE